MLIGPAAHTVAAAASETPGCTLASGQIAAVARVLSPQSLLLADGREVLLSSILAPVGETAGSDSQSWAPEREAREALEGLVRDNAIEISPTGLKIDRYGRSIAHVFAVGGGKRLWLSGALVESGNARVDASNSDGACVPDLLLRETGARRQRAGLWQNPVYAIRSAANTRDLKRLFDSFQIVDGRIAAVALIKSRVYLNFGDNWRWDFTAGVTLPKGTERDQITLKLKALQGRRVRVRGWVEPRNGPFLSINNLDAIELLDP